MESPGLDGSQTFTHEPLKSPDKQIRLFRFVKAGPTDVDGISIELSTWTDDETADYNAISYTWGDSTDPRSIQINGRSSTVTQKCHYALWQTWLYRPDGYVWIDSICMNQTDSEEKSIQVQKMGSIFTNANLVLVCVGPHSDNSDRIHDYAQDLDCMREELGGEYDDRNLWKTGHEFCEGEWKAWRGENYVQEAIEAIRAFRTRPYWSRLWIIQEVVLASARVVLCGDGILQWSSVDLLHGPGLHNRKSPFSIVLSQAQSNAVMTLVTVVTTTRKFHCADVRDKLYGTLGLMEANDRRWAPWFKWDYPSYTVDYNISPFELLLRVAGDLQFNLDMIYDAMSTFEQTSATPQMRELIAYARHGGVMPNSVINVEAAASLSTRSLHDLPDQFCEVREHPDGSLFANFQKVATEERIHWSATKFSIKFSRNDVPDGAKRVYCGSVLCAVLCAEARPGDLLLPSSCIRAENLLVLRRLDGEEYAIVGQGLSTNGCLPKMDEQYLNMRLNVKLTTLEGLLLYGQDFLGIDVSGKAMYDPQAQLQRLVTPVVLDSTPTAKASLVQVEKPAKS